MFKRACAVVLSLLAVPAVCMAQFNPAGPPQPVPLGDVVFVLDRSSSIDEAEYDDMVYSIVASIGTTIPHTANYRVAVVSFNDSTLSGPDIPFTRANDPALDAALAALTMTSTVGGTNVATGMVVAHDLMSTKSNAYQKHVIVLTDATSGQLGTSIGLARDLRDNYDTRVSVGYLRGDCGSLVEIPDCEDDLPGNAKNVSAMRRLANAPVNYPDFYPPEGPRLWGVLTCVDDDGTEVSQYVDHIAEALCPFGVETAPDVDNNLIPDVCDLFIDCDNNGVHDAFDPDCNGDLQPDACEIDCDGDGIPNQCDPSPGVCLEPCGPVVNPS